MDITKDFTSAPSAVVGHAGSITGLTYLYQFVFADREHAPPGSYALPGNNRYFRRLVAPSKGPAPTDAQMSRLREAARLVRSESWTDAEATLRPLVQEWPDSAEAHCYLALCQAHRGDLDAAVQSLQRAAECGWGNWRAWEENEAFAPLWNRKEFKEAVEKSKAVIEDVAPSLGFRNTDGWNARGERTASAKDLRYLLSVMLAVTSGRGNSVPEALDALRAAAGAAGTRPKGTFYFMRNENIRSTARDWLFPSAVAKLRAMGLAAELEDGIVPMDKPDVMGAVIGAAEYDWKASGSKILPGAICEDFTSAGGILTVGAGQTPLTSLIACGAAGSSGTVAEPLAIEEKFPSPFIHVHYARGCTLAEAFYQSVATPYQLLIVGDPLCAPWREQPDVVIEGLAAGQTVAGRFSLKPSAAPLSTVPVQGFEFYMDGLYRGRLTPGQSAGGDAKQMLEGYHEVRVVAITGRLLEERTSTTVPFTVDTSGRQWAISGPEKGEAPWDRPARVQAEFAGAAEIQFFHNLRLVGVVHGEKGAAEIDPGFLGQGPCRIQCVAVDAAKKPIAASAYIELRVVPPAPAPAVAAARRGIDGAGSPADAGRRRAGRRRRHGQEELARRRGRQGRAVVHARRVLRRGRGNGLSIPGPRQRRRGRSRWTAGRSQSPKPGLAAGERRNRAGRRRPARRRRVELPARLAREGPASPAHDRRRRKKPEAGHPLRRPRHAVHRRRLQARQESLVFSCVNWRTNLRN